MRKLAVAMALASTALVSTPALARDDSWYVGVEGGAMIVEDIKFDIGALKDAAQVDNHYGYDVDGQIGYDFGMFRLEAEVGYKSATLNNYQSTTTTPFTDANGVPGNVPAGTYNYAGGRTSALSFMVNGLLDFGDDHGLQGFVGGGVGVARVKASNYALNTQSSFLDDSDTVFAYQGLAGVRAPLSDHIDVSLKYRFFTADNVKLIDVSGRTFDGRFRSHSLLGGLTYNFGTPAAPPPYDPLMTPRSMPGDAGVGSDPFAAPPPSTGTHVPRPGATPVGEYIDEIEDPTGPTARRPEAGSAGQHHDRLDPFGPGSGETR